MDPWWHYVINKLQYNIDKKNIYVCMYVCNSMQHRSATCTWSTCTVQKVVCKNKCLYDI